METSVPSVWSVPSVPALLALASGQAGAGELACFYCGAPCDGSHPVAQHVKDSFTGRAGVVAPGSSAVCAGCVLCLREDCELTQIDGAIRRVTKGAMRAFSWAITPQSALAGSKAHLDRLRAFALNPPAPPWALVLSDSGQTHQLYRGVVNHGGPPWIVTLEAEPIAYTPAALADRLDLCGRVVAATGKPALSGPVDWRIARAVLDRYADGEAILARWQAVWSDPLSRLAGWLSPNKDSCVELYPSDREPPASPAPAAADPRHDRTTPGAGGPGRPGSAGRGRRNRGGDRTARDRGPTLFDFGEPLR